MRTSRNDLHRPHLNHFQHSPNARKKKIFLRWNKIQLSNPSWRQCAKAPLGSSLKLFITSLSSLPQVARNELSLDVSALWSVSLSRLRKAAGLRGDDFAEGFACFWLPHQRWGLGAQPDTFFCSAFRYREVPFSEICSDGRYFFYFILFTCGMRLCSSRDPARCVWCW